MSVHLETQEGNPTIEVQVSGKLTSSDYDMLVPAVEALISEHGKVRILFDMHDFHGWDLGALWKDTKFAMHHFRDIDRIAAVGESKWQKGMTTFCKPFTAAKIRYFERSQIADARHWLQECSPMNNESMVATSGPEAK